MLVLLEEHRRVRPLRHRIKMNQGAMSRKAGVLEGKGTTRPEMKRAGRRAWSVRMGDPAARGPPVRKEASLKKSKHGKHAHRGRGRRDGSRARMRHQDRRRGHCQLGATLLLGDLTLQGHNKAQQRRAVVQQACERRRRSQREDEKAKGGKESLGM